MSTHEKGSRDRGIGGEPSAPILSRLGFVQGSLIALVACLLMALFAYLMVPQLALKPDTELANAAAPPFAPRHAFDDSGFTGVLAAVQPWPPNASLSEIANRYRGVALRTVSQIDRMLAAPNLPMEQAITLEFTRATNLMFEGQVDEAYRSLARARESLEAAPELAAQHLYTVIFFQGLVSLRKGENENCLMCRGPSSCIVPIAPQARHRNETGSRLAIEHFREYLQQFPADQDARWLLNLAHMTLGEYPQGVDPQYLVALDHFLEPSHSIGRFRDIGTQLGVNRLNQAGGAIMDDFDNDRHLDLVVTSMDPTQSMGYFHNQGDGQFEERTAVAGLQGQLGGLNCVQTDFNNDGLLDITVIRGAWLPVNQAMRLSLLQNNGDGTFRDVTLEAGLGLPQNSIAVAWGDYDNDGFLDLFVGCEQQPNRLYRNLRDGTFRDVAATAGVAGAPPYYCKGATWLDFDNDGRLDLFVNHISEQGSQFFRNLGDGTFRDDTERVGIRGPRFGFSCWSWDYDNDGYLDIFATSYERGLGEAIGTLNQRPHSLETSRLYRNVEGRRFEDVTAAAGLDGCYVTMGSNFGDFDNDGFLDMYLATGAPSYAMLVPNRMLCNRSGNSFVDVTAPSGTGHLQKGHGVACGDWDRDGNVDLFVQMGGATNGDRYHNVLFQNPGHAHPWITLKLVGQTTNRAAIGARLKLTTQGPSPRTIYRTITSGSSFGGNPLEQTIGLGPADGIATLEVEWPTSGTKQTFSNLPLRAYVTITESVDEPHIDYPTTLPQPAASESAQASNSGTR